MRKPLLPFGRRSPDLTPWRQAGVYRWIGAIGVHVARTLNPRTEFTDMSSRFGWLILAFCASFILAACAEGAPAAPPGQQVADPLLGAVPAVCGDGTRDKSEMCDCPKTTSTMCMAPSDTTCASMGMGTGNVYCVAGQCILDTSSCSMRTTTGGGGNGAGRGG
jgi:hypothetical protein